MRSDGHMHHAKNVTAVALMLFLSALILPSMSSPIAQTPIVGVVYAEGNVPVRGATVTVTGSNCSGVGTTDANGNFQITTGTWDWYLHGNRHSLRISRRDGFNFGNCWINRYCSRHPAEEVRCHIRFSRFRVYRTTTSANV